MEAIIGVVVGFAPKALYDLVTENRRWMREDRLRLLDRKLSVYADMPSVSFRVREFLKDFQGAREKLANLQRDTDALLAEDHGDKSTSVPRAAEEQVGALKKQLSALKAQTKAADQAHKSMELRYQTDMGELNRVMGLLVIVAPTEVEEAARRLVGAAYPGGSLTAFAEAHDAFRDAAARDVGARR